MRLPTLVLGCALAGIAGISDGRNLCAFQSCPPIPGDGPDSIHVFLKKSDNACQVVEDMYVKAATNYEPDALVQANGTCQKRTLDQNGICFVYETELQGVAGANVIEQGVTGGLAWNPVPSNARPQTFDTRVDGTTSPEHHSKSFGTEGARTLTFKGTLSSTACLLTPNEIFKDFKVNVVKCIPSWQRSSGGALVHFAAQEILIYLGDANGATKTAFRDAFAAWNSALAAYPGTPRFAEAENPCSGPNCITVVNGTVDLSTHCAQTTYTVDSSTGLISGGTVTFPNQTTTWWPNFNKRLAGHELGHGLGLAEKTGGCNTTDSLMRRVSCNASSGYPTTPTVSDHLPVGKSTYGGTPTATCPAS
jgi:hypothetical protein